MTPSPSRLHWPDVSKKPRNGESCRWASYKHKSSAIHSASLVAHKSGPKNKVLLFANKSESVRISSNSTANDTRYTDRN